MKRKLYYQPNGGISAIPDLINDYNIKVFGCSNIEEYNNGEILFHRSKSNKDILINEINTFQPDIVFLETLSVDMLLAISEIRKFFFKPILLFWGDLIEQNSIILLRQIAKYVNVAYVIDKNSANILASEGYPVRYTFFPASSKLYYPMNLPKVYDTVFAGSLPNNTWYSRNKAVYERIELIKKFSERQKFALFGDNRWSSIGVDVNGWVDEYSLCKIYNQAKIVLASDQYVEIEGFTSNRTSKVLLAGAFLLIRKFNGIESMFGNHKHLVWSETPQEATELADYYLKNDSARETISKKGYDFAITNFDLKKSVDSWILTQIYENQTFTPCQDKFALSTFFLYYLIRRGVVRLLGEFGILTGDWFRKVK